MECLVCAAVPVMFAESFASVATPVARQEGLVMVRSMH
jgi:hypothetical protein